MLDDVWLGCGGGVQYVQCRQSTRRNTRSDGSLSRVTRTDDRSGCASWSIRSCYCDPQRPALVTHRTTNASRIQSSYVCWCIKFTLVERHLIYESASLHQPTSYHVLVCDLPAVNDTNGRASGIFYELFSMNYKIFWKSFESFSRNPANR